MRFVFLDEGRLELRWTWLPFWLAAGPSLHAELETLMRDAVIMNGMRPDDDSLDRIDAFVRRFLERRYPIPGLGAYLEAVRHVQEPK